MLIIVDLYLELVSFIVGCFVFRRSWPFAFRCLFLLNCIKFFVTYTSLAWSTSTHSSNHWMYNLFFPLQCAGLLWVFYRCSVHPKVVTFNAGLLLAFPVVVAVCWWLNPTLYSINIWATVSYSFLLLLSACMAFIDQLLRVDNVFFIRQPLFWLSSGVFFYSVASVICYSTWEYSKKMILYQLFRSIYFSSGYLLNAGIVGCFICIYIQRNQQRPGTVLQ